jgi:hypothetical protein
MGERADTIMKLAVLTAKKKAFQVSGFRFRVEG